MDRTWLHAEPGGQAQLSVTVRNMGHLVESFRLDVVGLDPTWWQVHPPELAVYPGREESAVVVLMPPANAQAPDDALPFAVRAASTLDAERTVVEEGDLEIGRIQDLQASIAPVTSRGRWSGRHTVTYTNGGNSPVRLRLSVSDRDEELGFRVEPMQVSVPVGGSAMARLRVRPRNPFLRGAPVRRPFLVVGESVGAVSPPGTSHLAAARVAVPDPSRPVLDGAIQQLPILSKGVVVLAGLLIAVVAGLVAAAMTTSKVVGARTPEVAPEPPIGLAANAVTAERIQLRWQPTDRAEHYRVQRVDDGDGSILQVVDVPDGATALDLKIDQPLTRACYRVVALHGSLASRSSDQQCATTPDGRLPPPTNVKATAVPNGYAVSWTDSDQNEHVVLVDGSPAGQPTPAGVSTVTVPAAPGEHCLTVLARRGPAQSSPPSAPPVCVQSAGPSTAGATTSAGAAPNPPRPVAPAPQVPVAPAPQVPVAPSPPSAVAPSPPSAVAPSPPSAVAPSPPSAVAPSPQGPVAPPPPGPTASSPPGPTGPTRIGSPPPPTGLTATRRNMSGSTGIALAWSTPDATSGWSISGYQVKTGTSTLTATMETEYLDIDSAHYCAPDITYQVTTSALIQVGGTPTSAESDPATITVTDPIDCTYPSRITSVTANPDGSVTVEAVCETDGRGPQQDTDIAVLFNDAIKETQRCQEGADPAHPDDPHTFTVTGLDPATSYTVTTRTTSPSGAKTSSPVSVTTA